MGKPKLNKRCKTCGKLLQDMNKTGFCNHHRDRTGENNSFYGKTHNPETIAQTKEKLRQISKDLWKDEEYREKVIKAVSKPRREGFKKEQSARVKQWYRDNPEQREARREHMRRSWREGKITKNDFSCNRSRIEQKFIKELQEVHDNVTTETISYGKASWLFPDGIIRKDGVVIEFYGNFWHANPETYSASDIIHHGLTAQNIWNRDEERIKLIKDLGYSVYTIWEKEWKENPGLILKRFDQLLNWESCAF